MPANFTEKQREEIRAKLLSVGYELIPELGLKKMKVSVIAARAEIATGTFYHFFPSKEAYVKALIDAQNETMNQQLLPLLQKTGKLSLPQALSWFRDSFRPENNLLMTLTTDDWVWLKAHREAVGLFDASQDASDTQRYISLVDGIRPDLDPRVIINFFKTIYSMAENRDTFIAEVFETNIDLIFECIRRYAAAENEH